VVQDKGSPPRLIILPHALAHMLGNWNQLP
jgi:hypothetical protein